MSTRRVVVVNCETGEASEEIQDATDDIAAAEEADARIIAARRVEAENVQVANINETDWIINPPADTPQDILNQINNNLSGWQSFRQGLRALPIATIEDPTQLVWPTHPIRPATSLTPPPVFLA